MTFSLPKSAFFLVLLATQAFCSDPELVSAVNNGVTLTAKAMTAGECIDLFYKDLRGNRIFPVALSIHNTGDKAFKLHAENIEISGATVLTPKRLESQISSMRTAICFFTFIFFPLAVFSSYQIVKLEALQPIIQKFSMGDTSLVIQPNQKVEKILFVQVNLPKDAKQSFIAPCSLNISITLKNNSFFSMLQASTDFNIIVPTI